MQNQNTELIFLYNADSGLANAVLDTIHKTLSPSTYSCKLCLLTYGATSMKEEWKKFLDTLPAKKTFLHKDEVEKIPEFKNIPLPAVLLKKMGKAEIIISSEDFKSLDLEGLMKSIKKHFK
ncbi:MAG: hypothetical protein H0X62_02315 [Bacteroidetes bacterium]|nr:hypothetical protein [Bacteroidota bacterium]